MTRQPDAALAATERTGRDLSRGWLPVSVVVSVVLGVGSLVWWAAGEHAAVGALRSDLDVQGRTLTAQATALADLTRMVNTGAQVQAAIQATLEAVKAELQRNSVILEDLRRRP